MGNNFSLNRVFSRNTIKHYLTSDDNSILEFDTIKSFLEINDEVTYKEIFEQLYKRMDKQYRNEYIYKSILFNKILLGIHSLNTTTAISELPIAKSKVDFVLINGKATAFEIKTELDNFDRLDKQLEDYFLVFDRVCLVVDAKSLDKAIKAIKNYNVGIYLITKRGHIKRYREPIEDKGRLSPEEMFKVLRKKEYKHIVKSIYGYEPSIEPVFEYNKYKEMFCNLDIETSFDLFKKELKKRNKVNYPNFSSDVPYYLKALVYFSNFKIKDYKDLNDFLKTKYRG